ncbi:GNAT family N-acetyltransferase [Gordonia sp. zg691]|uniref:GNAT family N-acetyltransferase n=1 Tax=Gordonia jinghuaiqii TaxID=2758710 RepID=A0A7D7QIA2_9ACTN|nr:GNAT family N-acetyltransferase [Gordonia jinghuaiqii]MBD0862675.1 GNAT family N-acetyltransferase [Gordonia jinghuaiqii]MCR5976757.1 GNAT family N-acetyltransferase [Gordonia jinghuaiqii]QMT03902.1 GNAT family N-acetyltransferase [Gordonia jinghuaiqii]
MNIDTARARLRPVSVVDIDELVHLDSDPEVMRYVSGGTATPRAAIEDWMLPRAETERRRHGTGTWVLCDPATSAFLGWISLRTPRHSSRAELELSYRLRRTVWGRGLATEAALALVGFAFDHLRTERVFASTVVSNESSRRVMEKLGMTLAAIHLYDDDTAQPQELLTEDPDRDRCEVEYEILRADWQARSLRWSSPGGLTA